MLRCDSCKVNLPGAPTRCPLCQRPLSGEPDGSADRYPPLSRTRTFISKAMVAWISFGSFCAVAICVTINLILPSGGWWSLFVIAGVASFWIDFALLVRERRNIIKNILWQIGTISVIALLWDVFNGFYGWSIDYVIPIISTGALVTMMLISKIKKLGVQDYIFYLVIVCLIGFVSLVLILVGAVNVVIPSAICFGTSVIFLAALLFFQGKDLISEFQRRMHL